MAFLFSQDHPDLPPLVFEVTKPAPSSGKIGQSIWERAAWLMLNGKEAEADALLEEFNLPPSWDDPLN